MRRDNLCRVQMESINLETQLAIEIGVGLAQSFCIPLPSPISTSVLADERWRNGPG